MPVTKDEEEFLLWWESRREGRRRLGFAVWMGLPAGCLLAFPIFINFIAGRFWYKRADAVGSAQFQPFVLVLAVVLIAGFTGWMHSRMQWEQNEERYRILRAKQSAMESPHSSDES